MDDRRAALLLALLAAGGAVARFALAPRPGAAPGEVRLAPGAPAQRASRSTLAQTAGTAARLARPLAPGETIDVDQADATELTRLPRIGPALARRIADWRSEHGPFGTLARLDSVPGIGPGLLAALKPYVTFSGARP